MDQVRIDAIVQRVLERIQDVPSPGRVSRDSFVQLAKKSSAGSGNVAVPKGTLGVYSDVDQAVAAANQAFVRVERTSLELRAQMIRAMRDTARANLRELSVYAHAETGLGRVEDKIAKNTLVLDKTPGVEILQPQAQTGDHGLMLTERAPYGVILAVTPCTNPTETVLCNAIGMIAGGNSVVFNVHPSARRVCNWLVHLLNQAILGVGGPMDALVSIEEPTIGSAQALMSHEGVRLVVVTGGPAVVKTAMNSGKKTIGAGPGNPPAVVDDSADLVKAADAIVRGATLDNNIVCIAEKEIIALRSIADDLSDHLGRSRALVISAAQLRELERVVMSGDAVNKTLIGKDASLIAAKAGIRGHGADLRALVCRVDEGHPFVQHELLMPVLPMVEAQDAPDAIAMALRVEHGFHHTATMHSRNVDHLAAMARVCNCSIFVKNAPSYAGLGLGGEGYTSFTIASPTGEGLTTAKHFTRERRCTLSESFRFV